MKETFGLHWFRRDLRINGNENLLQNCRLHHGRVLGVFFFDSVFLARKDFSHNRFAFFLKTLGALQQELREKGGDLIVIDQSPQKAFPALLDYFKKQNNPPGQISFGRDYEPFAIRRDAEMVKVFEKYKVPHFTGRDHLLLEPHEVVKDNESFYQVYTPFSKRWFAKFQTPEIQKRLKTQNAEVSFSLMLKDFKNFPYADALASTEAENQKSVTVKIPAAGHGAALKVLQSFKKRMAAYAIDRDFPALTGTSQLSIYLKNGSIVPAQVISGLGLGRELNQYLKEIIWREFYYSVLFHKPQVEHEAFQEKYKDINWSRDKKSFKLWCEGQTGFPIVDAGMRQLNQTGWMHNRVRMIVASFLTKDLLIDWRLGENYFMKMLLDGDLAPNNGGWQWAASTGCDPQPYFRIFNPWLQSAKFDADATYIKKWIPELRNVSPKDIHSPDGERGSAYPAPMVVHAEQSRKAIALFKVN